MAAFTVVEVPAMAGDPQHPAAAGPATITGALRDAGYGLPARRVSVGSPTGDTIADSIRVNTTVRNVVRAIAAHGGTPLVLAGSCDVASGIVAGLGRPDVGVIWLDAHADFNTPESSISGFWPGMTLAVVVGDCGHNVWSALGGRPVAPEHVLLLGVRSLSPEEESRRLQQSAIQRHRPSERDDERDLAVVSHSARGQRVQSPAASGALLRQPGHEAGDTELEAGLLPASGFVG